MSAWRQGYGRGGVTIAVLVHEHDVPQVRYERRCILQKRYIHAGGRFGVVQWSAVWWCGNIEVGSPIDHRGVDMQVYHRDANYRMELYVFGNTVNLHLARR